MAQGSITKHVAADGTVTWRARASGGVDPATGKRRQPMESFKLKGEAQTWLREQQRRADRGEWATGGTTTLAEWVITWLAGPGARGRRPTTVRTYALVLAKHVVPALGAVRLSKLNATQLEALVSGLEARMAPASVSLIYAALHICLADAERLGVIAASPMRRVKAPSVPPVDRPHWSEDEAGRFLAAITGDDDRALWLTMLLAGMRVGEALALNWEDCDFTLSRLHVRRTVTRDRQGQRVVGDTTKSGKARTVPMPPVLAGALRAQRARVLALRMAQADVWQDTGLVFPGLAGGRGSAEAARSRLHALCASAGVPVISPHGMRHTCASLLGEVASAAEVRDLLGHHNVSVTNRYLHSDGRRQAAAVEALAVRLGGR